MMATQSNTAHPLPTAPGGAPQSVHYAQYEPTDNTPRPPQHKVTASQASNNRPKSRSFSFKSDKSHRSSNSNGHNFVFGPETHAEKQAKRLHTKADPTMAINEVEPAKLAATEKTQLTPLRSINHRDSYGNPIAEPDVSNPTRSRWERPLDTIRSFEAAIDGGYNRKSSYGGDGESVANFGGSRRNSRPNLSNARFPQDSYYGGRSQSYLPTSSSAFDLRQGRGSAYNDQAGYNNDGGRQRYSRMASEPQIYGMQNNYNGQGGAAGVGSSRMGGEQGVYPMPSNHRSYETVASGAGSGILGEPAGYQTDPTSSDNSSIERNGSPSKRFQQQQQQQQQAANEYNPGFQGFSGGPQINLNSYGGAANGPNGSKAPIQLSSATAPPSASSPYWQQKQQQQQQAGPPPPPPVAAQKNSLLRKVTKSGSESADKRKSWFSKRFSKQD